MSDLALFGPILRRNRFYTLNPRPSILRPTTYTPTPYNLNPHVLALGSRTKICTNTPLHNHPSYRPLNPNPYPLNSNQLTPRLLRIETRAQNLPLQPHIPYIPYNPKPYTLHPHLPALEDRTHVRNWPTCSNVSFMVFLHTKLLDSNFLFHNNCFWQLANILKHQLFGLFTQQNWVPD